LPPKASLAQLKNPRLLCDEPEPEAAVSAWTEAESAREEASFARGHVASLVEEVQQRRLEPGQVVLWWDQPRSQAAEAMSRADVLGGQPAKATERSVEVFARAGTLTETLAMMARAWCWPPPSRWRSFCLCRRPRPGQLSPRVEAAPRVEMKPRVPLLPRVMPDSAGAVCLEHACVFRGCRGLNTLLSCYKVVFLFLLFRVSGLFCR
jgi:hypothetical protein